jgi:hypothetical protein
VHIQQRFAALYFKRYFPQVYCSYSVALEQLKLHTLRERRYHLKAPFLIKIYVCAVFCHSVLGTYGLRVPAWYIRDCALLNFYSSNKNFSSATCPASANIVCRDVGISGSKTVFLNHILQWFFIHIKVQTVRSTNVCILMFSHRIMTGTNSFLNFYYCPSFLGLV